MAKKIRKTHKKIVSPKKTNKRSLNSLTLSFVVGLVTVMIVALLIFEFAQNNNYKTVLGTHTYQQQTK